MTSTDSVSASMGGPLSEADRIPEIKARLDAASSMPWEAGDVWGWAGLVWTADGTRDWDGNGTRCSYCRDSDPVDVKVRDINGEEMMAHLHRLPEPWDLDSAISDADGELVVRSVPDPADHNLILHAPADLAYLLERVGVLEGQLAKAREDAADMRAALERRLLQVKSIRRDGHTPIDPMLCTTPVTTVEEEIEDARLWWTSVGNRNGALGLDGGAPDER